MTSLALFVFCPWGWKGERERERALILTLQHRKQSSPGWKQTLKEPFGRGIPLLSAFPNIWFHVGKRTVTLCATVHWKCRCLFYVEEKRFSKTWQIRPLHTTNKMKKGNEMPLVQDSSTFICNVWVD